MLIVYWIRLGFEVVDDSLPPFLLVCLRCWIGCMAWCQVHGVVLVSPRYLRVLLSSVQARIAARTLPSAKCVGIVLSVSVTVSVREGENA